MLSVRCIEVLPLLMTSLETATPLVLKRSSVTLTTLQELLGGVEFCCRSKALDCSATPSEVVESYRDCLNEQILSSKKGKIFKVIVTVFIYKSRGVLHSAKSALNRYLL